MAESNEEKYAPKLPKQIQDQVDAVNAAIAAVPEQQPQPQPQDEQQPDGGEEVDGGPDGGQEPEPESWEQRARSAVGRLEQALSANQQLSRRISELEMQASSMKINGTGPTQPQSYAKPQLIKPEEVNDYGDEFFDVVGRKAREEFSPELHELGERLKRLESGHQAVTEVVTKTRVRSVYDMLYDEVPQWKQINHSPEFKQWLQYPDPYSGKPLGELLQDAFSRQDGERVVNFFRGFAEAAGLPQNPPDRGSSAPPLTQQGNGSGKPTLEQFAAPGRARSAPQTLPPDKPMYTTAQVAALSEQKRRGLWRGREAELEAIERDIFAAQHEGRLVP